jgi:hypothetical protein
MYIDAVERMKKIHIWIGNTSLNQEKYDKYFSQDDDVSDFFKDLGIFEEYDEDFIGIIPIFKEALPIEEIFKKEIPINNKDVTKAINECRKLDVLYANAVVFLTDSTVLISDIKDSYNGLKYIGLFKSCF